MKTIGVLVKEKIINEIKNGVRESEGSFFIGFNKLQAFSFNTLRNNLKGNNARILVAKNSLLEKAFKDMGFSDINDLLGRETGVVISRHGDIVKICKILTEFSKEKGVLQLKGGFLKDRKVTDKDLEALAKLPSREVLLGMAVRGIASPLTSFVSVLNQVIVRFLWTLEEIKKKKG